MMEEMFGECGQCHEISIIVFECAWRGQRDNNGKWIRGNRFLFCSTCCRSYGQLPNNYEYDIKAKEMCEVLNGNKE